MVLVQASETENLPRVGTRNLSLTKRKKETGRQANFPGDLMLDQPGTLIRAKVWGC